jgi:hypothetical protein
VAFYKAAKGKRDRADVVQFSSQLEQNIQRLAILVGDDVFEFGNGNEFDIFDPKHRTIHAPEFSERVVHHAVMNVCELFFNSFLISDTYACRIGMGRELCVGRAHQFSKRFPYCLKLDMRSYFHSIDHTVLKRLLTRKFKDHKLLHLFNQIIGSYEKTKGKGLPIGSLASQHFANFYLGWFDHFVKNELRIKGYVRYMDDCIIWDSSFSALRQVLKRCQLFLHDELKLETKPKSLSSSKSGFVFLGCKIRKSHVQLNRRSRNRYKSSMKLLEHDYLIDEISFGQLVARAESLTSFIRSANVRSWRFRTDLLQCLPVSGRGHQPGEPGR